VNGNNRHTNTPTNTLTHTHSHTHSHTHILIISCICCGSIEVNSFRNAADFVAAVGVAAF